MAGVREGGGPPQPLHPKEHVSTWGGSPSVSCLPPPTAPNKRRSPSPRGNSPPQPGLYIQWFSAVLWLRGPRVGEVARQSQSLSWTVAVTRVCWSILGPTVCAICFSELHKPTKATAQSETSPQNQKLKTGSFRVTL